MWRLDRAVLPTKGREAFTGTAVTAKKHTALATNGGVCEVSTGSLPKSRKQDDLERALHFCGVSFWDEVNPEERSEVARQCLKAVLGNPETCNRYRECVVDELSNPWTFSTRSSGLAIALANCIVGLDLYDRTFLPSVTSCANSRFLQHDPSFGAYVDRLIGLPTQRQVRVPTDLPSRRTISIADFGCAPAKGGSGTLNFVKGVLGTLLPDRVFEFAGYDVNFRGEYPLFSEAGTLVGWEKGYEFDTRGTTQVHGVTYFNSRESAYNIVPKSEGRNFRNTFDVSHARYDIVLNSMFYSVHEMNGVSDRILEQMLQNMLAVTKPGGVLFLSTCDDCFKVFPAPATTPVREVLPFICSIDNVESKALELLVGGKYCKGCYSDSDSVTEESRHAVECSLYRAHRLAVRDATFLDRLFEAYRMIDRGSSLEDALALLVSAAFSLDPAKRAATRERIYARKKGIA